MAVPLWQITGDTLHHMIQTGYEVDSVNNSGMTLLFRATFTKRPDLIRTLLAHGANPNLGTDVIDIGAPLRMAVFQCRFDLVHILITHGANVSQLHLFPDLVKPALQSGNSDLIIYLLQCGLDCNLVFSDGSSLVNHASKLGLTGLVEFLLPFHPNLGNVDSSGQTCIFHAVINSNALLTSRLISYNAQVNLHDAHGFYLLYYAIKMGNADIM
ncbi:hypothetical protein QAD02_002642 [Eretmocerus hayati]|uniref:Uncharacterized protein n=1 Tax=Eretmocerus hayati TaxID=131215 RepID=A0ACC2NKG3_9HYME|nr:hypothetical protein QAD02_002642 [Eretmocerus hayati]